MGNLQFRGKSDVDSLAQLTRSAKVGDVHELASCLRRVNVNVKLQYGNRALHLAAEHGHSLMCKMLIRTGAKLHLTDDSEMNALQCASAAGHANLVPILADCGVGSLGQSHLLSNKDVWGRTALHKAVINRHTDTALALLHAGADVNAGDKIKRTPLHVAASYGDSCLAECCIRYGANVNACDDHGQTPLYLAVVAQNTEMIKFLVSKNSRLQTVAKNQLTPLTLACQRRYLDCVRTLVELGAPVESGRPDEHGRRDVPYYYLLHGHLSEEILECCALVLRASPRLELPYYDYNITAHVIRLLTSTQYKQLYVVLKLLLAMGAAITPFPEDNRNTTSDGSSLNTTSDSSSLITDLKNITSRYQQPVALTILAARKVRSHCSPNVLFATRNAQLPWGLKKDILLENL